MPCPLGGRAGQAVIIGVRPEHLRLDEAGAGMIGQVTLVEPTGAQVQIVAETGSGSLTAVLNERVMPKIGSTIAFSPAAGSLHVFDGETGRRLEFA